MKKVINIILTFTMVFVSLSIFTLTVNADYEQYSEYNLIDEQTATFEGGIGNWEIGLADGEPTLAKGKGIDGDAMLSGPRAQSYACPYLNIAPIILENGPGQYNFSCYVKAAGEGDGSLRLLFRDANAGYGFDTSPVTAITEDEWALLEVEFNVSEADKANNTFTVEVIKSFDKSFIEDEHTVVDGKLYMAFDQGSGPIYIDNVCVINLDKISSLQTATPAPTPEPTPTVNILPTTALPIATVASTAATTPTATAAVSSSEENKSNPALIITLVSLAVLALGGGLAYIIRKKYSGSKT